MRKPAAGAGSSCRSEHQSTKFGEDEDDLIIKLHALLGNRWSLIAGRLPGRKEKQVKKHWNKHLRLRLKQRKKLLRMGIHSDGSSSPATTHHNIHSHSATTETPPTKSPPPAPAPTTSSPPPPLLDLNLHLTIASPHYPLYI